MNLLELGDEIGDGQALPDRRRCHRQPDRLQPGNGQDLLRFAYDTAIAEGLMDEDDVIEIMVGTPNSTSAFYNNGYES